MNSLIRFTRYHYVCLGTSELYIAASQVTGISHFDGCGLAAAIDKLMQAVIKLTGGKQWGR